MKNSVIYFLILQLVCGCNCIPKYEPPSLCVPCEWHSSLAPNMDTSRDDILWWKKLNDPKLDELMSRALDQNIDLSIAASRILQAKIACLEDKKRALPHIDGSLSYGGLHYNHETLRDLLGVKKRAISDRNNVNFLEVGFDAKWEIDLLNLGKGEKERLRAKLQSACWDYFHVWVILSAEIAKNYIELKGGQLRFSLLERAEKLNKEYLLLAKDLYHTGFIDASLYLQAEQQDENLAAEKVAVKLSVTQVIHRLAILLGLPPCALFDELHTLAPIPKIPCHIPVGIPSELLRYRPDIRRAERDLAGASGSVASAVAALFPRLTIRGFIGDVTSFHSSSFTSFESSEVLAPIFNSQLLKQNVRLEKAKAKEAFYEYQKTVLGALEETENALSSYQAGVENRQLFINILHSKQTEYQLAEQLYQTGWKNYLDVIIAKKRAVSAELQLLKSEVELLLHYISLYKSLGGGW